MTSYDWQKSSYCGTGEACVHVAAADGRIRLTESSDLSGVILRTTPRAWSALLHSIKQGPRHA